jgi:truncated hemoglobin YjbI
MAAIGPPGTFRKISEAFYARVNGDPVLRPLFPGKTLRCAIEEFAAFLAQLLGGPAEDAQRRWWLSLRESHLRFKIGPRERDAWMKNMIQALDDVELDESMRTALHALFERSSAYVVNQGRPPSVVATSIDHEMEQCWAAQLALDEAVAAVRSGDADRAIELAETVRNRSVFAGLLALMIAHGQSHMVDYVRRKLLDDPALARERYSGRTLLHGAAAAGSLIAVELLLHLGAEPDATDPGGHTALYCVGNECSVTGGGDVVRALVQGGANVNASDGVKRCTALHMAARRGNVEVARALLDCGADVEARDSLGDTPLRRSVNCNKPDVALLLLTRGADKHSKGSKGLTPLSAARSSAMKRLLDISYSHSS